MHITACILTGKSSHDRAWVANLTWASEFRDWGHDALFHGTDPCAFLDVERAGTLEGPGSCWEKRHNGLSDASVIGSDWLACFSDDNYVFVQNLIDALDGLARAPHEPLLVGGHSGEYRLGDARFIYPSGGAGYCLNRAATQILYVDAQEGHLRENKWKAIGGPQFEDVFIGWACKELGIRYVEMPGFYGCNPLTTKTCHPDVAPGSKPISFHYVNEAQMLDLHKNRRLYT